MAKEIELAKTVCARAKDPLMYLINHKDIPSHVFTQAIRAMDAVKELELLLLTEKKNSKWKQTKLPLE